MPVHSLCGTDLALNFHFVAPLIFFFFTYADVSTTQQQRPSLFETLFIFFVYQSIVHSQASSSVHGGLLDVWMLNGKKGLLVARRDKNAVVALTSPTSCPLFLSPSTQKLTGWRSVGVRSSSVLYYQFLRVLIHSCVTGRLTSQKQTSRFKGHLEGGAMVVGSSKGIARTLNWIRIP